MTRPRYSIFRRPLVWLLGLLTLGVCSESVMASAASPLAVNWNEWWINTNYAEHGKSVDHIFYFIFWLTGIITVVVEIVLVWFMFKYRHREGSKKAVYSHGNTRLEMIWTLIPAVILIVLAMWTKRSWDNYRYSPAANDPNTPKILVIGEQFQWNVLYGGPQNKIGRFLMYPKPTDLTWPLIPEGQSFTFPDVKGPAYLPESQAINVLKNYTGSINPLGRDYTDPDTNHDPNGDHPELAKLNDSAAALGRFLYLPLGREVEIQLGSKDVIHDFFLPNFRSRLDVVPGMRGRLFVKTDPATPCSAFYTLAQLDDMIKKHQAPIAIVNEAAGGVLKAPAPRKPKIWKILTPEGSTLVSNEGMISLETLEEARKAGIKQIFAAPTYDIVCEELCGMAHAKMSGKVVVLDPATLSAPPYNIYFAAPAPAH